MLAGKYAFNESAIKEQSVNIKMWKSESLTSVHIPVVYIRR